MTVAAFRKQIGDALSVILQVMCKNPPDFATELKDLTIEEIEEQVYLIRLKNGAKFKLTVESILD